jgi:hypothetical protein
MSPKIPPDAPTLVPSLRNKVLRIVPPNDVTMKRDAVTKKP